MEKFLGPKVERLVGLERGQRAGFQVNIQPTLYQGAFLSKNFSAEWDVDLPPLFDLLFL